MRWMRFEMAGRTGFGRVDGDVVEVHEGDLFAAPRPTGEHLPLAEIAYLPPCQPRMVLALWNNFRAAAERNGWSAPVEPLVFGKTVHSLTGHDRPIPPPPPEMGRIAYEGELAIVIGRTTRSVSVDDAPAHIFGYTCANDLTALELLSQDPSFSQWTRAKSGDGFCPLGPWIETAFDPATASLRTVVAGRERQHFPLADMFFPPAEIVSRLSRTMRLEPGDVILCGTSTGVLPMKAGSRVEVTIDGIGTLANTFG
jgi:2-keto-4-pentenoate hydratase/2-oxohepta-3-ene-1,7-dioic acid hydratase in catechol pathway